MKIDGKKIAEEIKEEIKREVDKSQKTIKLAIVQVGSNSVSEKFIEKKEKFAEEVGAKTKVYKFPDDISTTQLRKKMAEICHVSENSGVIIQLPLPKHINTQYILDSIPLKKDVDVLSSKAMGEFAAGKTKILPPVVGAVKEILLRSKAPKLLGSWIPKSNIVVIGQGRLVGKSVAAWLMNQGATVSVLDENTKDISLFTKQADMIISGAGAPHIIKPEMIKDGVVLIDAGTSEQAGKLAGDIDPACESKASLFTPVPGGVGPITVVTLFKNLIELNTPKN